MRFIHLLFFLLYGMVSILNHYFLRSAGLDYGIANQALYLYASAKPPMVTLLLGDQQVYHYMGLHVSLWVPILSPFYWIFGSYTLLIFQSVCLVFGAIGLGKLATHFNYLPIEKVLIQLHYYVFFGIFNALANDYHDNVIAACFLPWLVLGYVQSNKGIAWLAFFAMLLSKENISIWLLAIALGLWLLKNKGNKVQTWQPLYMGLIAVAWFLICSNLIMPHYSAAGKFEQLNRYSHLGKSLPEILHYVITHPLHMLRMFYQSHIQPDADEIIKQEFLWALLFSGAWIALLRPPFLIMLLPLLMQKLWNKETAFWGANNHYQVEFAALLNLALLFVFKNIKGNKRMALLALVSGCALVQTVSLMQERKAWFDPIKENLLNVNHYKAAINTKEVSVYLNQISKEESICAQSNFLPHLANRTQAYHFPYYEQANLIIISKATDNYYPLSAENGKRLIDSLLTSQAWEALPNDADLWVLKRR